MTTCNCAEKLCDYHFLIEMEYVEWQRERSAAVDEAERIVRGAA